MTMQILIDRNVFIPMRDGIRLCADIYRPVNDIPVPAILVRLPYDKDDLMMHMEAVVPVRAAEQGYAVVYQDTRGRYRSEGDFYPFVYEGQDGYDTIEWIAAQAWCSGAVGMSGASYFGATQWLAAIEQPPHLRAIAPVVTSSEYYEGWTYQGGAFQLGFCLYWVLLGLAPDTIIRLAKAHEGNDGEFKRLLAALDDIEEQYHHLPLSTLPIFNNSQAAGYYFDWLAHETRDVYWKGSSIQSSYDKIQVPAFNIGGWYDLFLKGTLENYEGMRAVGGSAKARKEQRLLVAPWSHGNFSAEFPGIRFGEAASAYGIDLQGEVLQFFDHHLKEKDAQVEDPQRVRIFIMGENCWRNEADWPLPDTEYVPWYLHSDGSAGQHAGKLSLQPPTSETADSYVYDPHHPAPTVGGPTFLPGLRAGFNAGPLDQGEVEKRSDVLTFTTDPLAEALEVIGPLTMRLWASSSAPDTHFVAKLCDVYPDGTSRLLSEGILRACFRHGFERAEWLTPGQVALFEIDMVATANVFLPGHRIRVDVTSSSFPRFNVHPNTNQPLADYSEQDFVAAKQYVFHDSDHASQIILPVINRKRDYSIDEAGGKR
jgi:uncharacterized protein